MKAGEPYTDAGLARQTCCHCQERKAERQWSVALCANGRKRVWVAVCTPCDIAFNEHTLRFIRHPQADRLMTQYREQHASA